MSPRYLSTALFLRSCSSSSITATSSCSTVKLTPAILPSTRDPDTKDFPCPSCHAPYPSHTPYCSPSHFFCKECFAPEPSSSQPRHHFLFCKLREKRRQKHHGLPPQPESAIAEWENLAVRPGFLREGNGVLGWDAEMYGDLTPVQRRLASKAGERKAQEGVEMQEKETVMKAALSRSVSSSSTQTPTALRWLIGRMRRSSSVASSDV